MTQQQRKIGVNSDKKKTPEQIAEEIVEWFPHSAFTYDTHKKLKRDIAAAIKAERETNDHINTNHRTGGVAMCESHNELMGYRLIRIPMFFGQINIKRTKWLLFSERNGYVPTFSLLGVSFTWRKRK